MTNLGVRCNFLKVSEQLKACLQEIGENQHFAAGKILFAEDGDNCGVFLLVRGKARMSVKSVPRLDRMFCPGSLLGLPSTFTGRPYSLTAEALTETAVIHVPAEPFLQLMRERPDLCSEATAILGREVTFIQSALAERHKQGATKKFTSTNPVLA
jgi:CRP-like cAMP-binding protein